MITPEEDDEFDGIDVGKLIAEAMREDDENDPLLESYQHYKAPDDGSTGSATSNGDLTP